MSLILVFFSRHTDIFTKHIENIVISGRMLKWNFIKTMSRKTLELITQGRISTPSDYISGTKEPSFNTEALVMTFAALDSNISVTGNSMPRINYCAMLTLNDTLETTLINLPFGVDFDNNLYSFVTCSGAGDDKYSLLIAFNAFSLSLWIFFIGPNCPICHIADLAR